MAHSESVEYIDLTPTWEALLPQWLYLYRHALKGDADSPNKIIKDCESELFRMAEAADKWNAHCKELR